MLNNAEIINAAWLYSQVKSKRICAELKKPQITDFGRCHYKYLLGHYKELGYLAEPYKNFIFPLETLIEGSADHELETLQDCKTFVRVYKRNLKAFYLAGGTKLIPERLVDFLKEVHSRPPELKSNEKGIKIVNYLLEYSGDGPDIFYGDRDDYKSITTSFENAPKSRIDCMVILFSQIDSMTEIDLTLPVPQIRKAIQDQMNRFSEFLG